MGQEFEIIFDNISRYFIHISVGSIIVAIFTLFFKDRLNFYWSRVRSKRIDIVRDFESVRSIARRNIDPAFTASRSIGKSQICELIRKSGRDWPQGIMEDVGALSLSAEGDDGSWTNLANRCDKEIRRIELRNWLPF